MILQKPTFLSASETSVEFSELIAGNAPRSNDRYQLRQDYSHATGHSPEKERDKNKTTHHSVALHSLTHLCTTSKSR